MILFSTVLAILLFATPNADAQRCNRWNICYEQIQQQENSAVQETFKAINRTLISLEHEKNFTSSKDDISKLKTNMTKLENLVASQSKVIAISKDDISKLKTNMTKLENLVASQSKVISSQSDLINKLSSCNAEQIEHATSNFESVQHGNTITYTCEHGFATSDRRTRVCDRGHLKPTFLTEPFACYLWSEWVKGECSVTCGKGSVTFTRTCSVGSCVGESTKTEDCEEKVCPEHKLKLVTKKLKREPARQHCVDNFGGDLIQHDPRLYTIEGRQEMSESLNLPTGHTYHTGVRRDEDRVWRRSSDGAAVRLEDWWAGYPRSDASHKFLYWGSWNGSYNNLILNYSDDSDYFVCEY